MAENDRVICSKDKLKEIFGCIEEARAVQTLEYYDKNFLSGNNASRSRAQIDLLTDALNMLSDAL